VKGTHAALEAGNIDEAKKLAREATRLLDKAAVHGVLHKNNVSRKISRLNKKVAAAS